MGEANYAIAWGPGQRGGPPKDDFIGPQKH